MSPIEVIQDLVNRHYHATGKVPKTIYASWSFVEWARDWFLQNSFYTVTDAGFDKHIFAMEIMGHSITPSSHHPNPTAWCRA